VPDGRLLEGLRAWRGRGRNDYPVRVLWGVLLLQIALRHTHAEAMLAELKRNPALRELIGIEDEDQVPNGYNVLRFLAEWFGYKLHLLVDVKHEVALAYAITSAKAGDGETLPTLLHEAQANLPANRIQTLAYDKAADTNGVHETLDQAKIKPLMQMRSLWQDHTEEMLPGHDGRSNVVYDEAGTLYCYDRTSVPMIRHRMAYIGHEPQRQTIKYRCPARHEGWTCPHDAVCNAGKSYGKTVRVDQTIDLRRFPPIPRATKKFERMYQGRTAVERVNARLKVFWGADDGNLVGAERFYAMVGTVMIVHATFATLLPLGPSPRRHPGQSGPRTDPKSVAAKTRSLTAFDSARPQPLGMAIRAREPAARPR